MVILFRAVIANANKETRRKIILERTRKNKDTIYGAQSIKAQIGIYARPTNDYDIFTKNPKKSAMEAEKQLDKGIGFNYFYTKPAMHPGTWKVRSRGVDMRKGTDDDMDIIDYSKHSKPKPKTIKINGVNFRNLKGEADAKLKALRDPEYKFRHEKDADDLGRIRMFQQANRPKKINLNFKMPKIRFTLGT